MRSNPLFGNGAYDKFGDDVASASSYSSVGSGSIESLDLDNLSNFELPDSEEEEVRNSFNAPVPPLKDALLLLVPADYLPLARLCLAWLTPGRLPNVLAG